VTLRPYSQTLQQAYRDTLGTPGAPEAIDDAAPVVPVAVVAQVNTSNTASYMRITDGTDTVAVSSAGSLYVEVAKSLSRLTGVNNNASTPTTLGTVPALKKWRIYGATMSVCGGNATGNVKESVLQAASTDLMSLYTYTTATVYAQVANNCCYNGYVEIAATQTVTLLSADSGLWATATVYYEEVDA